eukprot:scpid107223/ scgid7416/ 
MFAIIFGAVLAELLVYFTLNYIPFEIGGSCKVALDEMISDPKCIIWCSQESTCTALDALRGPQMQLDVHYAHAQMQCCNRNWSRAPVLHFGSDFSERNWIIMHIKKQFTI